MKRKTARILGVIMLLIANIFLFYALQHPELSWPWNNTITFTLYAAYLLVMAVLFLAPFKK